MQMILLTFLGILTAEFVSGENRVDRLETIKAVEGDDVRLQCRLDPSLDLSAYTSDWVRDDLNGFVHIYRRKKDLLHLQMDQYRNRTTLNREDLSRGVLTLQISSVKLLDSGHYRCYVPELNVGCVVNLAVEKEQQKETKRADSTTTGPPEEEVTEPDDPGDGNRNVVRAGIISTVVFLLFVLFVLVLKKKNDPGSYGGAQRKEGDKPRDGVKQLDPNKNLQDYVKMGSIDLFTSLKREEEPSVTPSPDFWPKYAQISSHAEKYQHATCII